MCQHVSQTGTSQPCRTRILRQWRVSQVCLLKHFILKAVKRNNESDQAPVYMPAHPVVAVAEQKISVGTSRNLMTRKFTPIKSRKNKTKQPLHLTCGALEWKPMLRCKTSKKKKTGNFSLIAYWLHSSLCVPAIIKVTSFTVVATFLMPT